MSFFSFSWYQPAKDFSTYNNNLASLWVKIASSWICILLYVWTCIAPALSLEEYRLGQHWTEKELFKETLQTCSTCITIDQNISEEKRLEMINEKVPLHLESDRFWN